MILEDRSAFAFNATRPRRWQAPPIEQRVARWLKRIAKNTVKYPRPHRLEIRQTLATVLGLPTRWVELREDGSLWHTSRLEPIATLHDS